MTTAIDIAWDVSQLSFEQTIPRSLVHKRSLENVLLTEIRSCGPDRFICAGRIPSAHRFFNDAGRTPCKDILFYTELGRQASLAVSHTFLDVPRDEVFIFEGSEASISEAAWQCAPEPGADSVLTEIRIHEIARRKNEAVSRVVAEHTMSAGQETGFPRYRRLDASASGIVSKAAADVENAWCRGDRGNAAVCNKRTDGAATPVAS